MFYLRMFFLLSLTFSQKSFSFIKKNEKISLTKTNKIFLVKEKLQYLKSLKSEKIFLKYIDFFQIKLLFLEGKFKDLSIYVKKSKNIRSLINDSYFAKETLYYLLELQVFFNNTSQ